ncbi:hypothetical protein HC031_18415 [Planosporangium thailandense]|uniref:Lipoprotein n=1 Tax=Planosporangium thailandense TaxID=765197 RepID=A0ABX0Y2L6_9ACTN|nr:hypothetical protein [Planosporangium thailandense]NJC71679.1 hypothetical protein [Planosporangium thailandense]
MSMGSRQRAVTTLLVSLAAAGLLTGCGGPAGTPSAADGSRSAGSSIAPSPSASAVASGSPSTPATGPTGGGPTGAPVPPPTGGPSTVAGEITLQGQVDTGAEPSCLMLRSGGHLYHLLNGDTAVVKAGNNVVVQGHVVKGVMSHCMQGVPFMVTHARAA